MPSNPAWLHRVPEICAELSALRAPVVDRAAVERMFGLRRRQAIELLHRVGGYQVGRTFVVDRLQLIAELEQMQSAPEFEPARRQRQKVVSELDKMRRNRAATEVRIPVRAEVFGLRVDGLSKEIRLEAGLLASGADNRRIRTVKPMRSRS
jgi:hypothetical protein